MLRESRACEHRYVVRSWRADDRLAVERLVRRVQEVGVQGGLVLNPEGQSTADCLAAYETYAEGGGAFLVVVEPAGEPSLPRRQQPEAAAGTSHSPHRRGAAPLKQDCRKVTRTATVTIRASASAWLSHSGRRRGAAGGSQTTHRTCCAPTAASRSSLSRLRCACLCADAERGEERVVACAGLLVGDGAAAATWFDGGGALGDDQRPCVAVVRRVCVDVALVPAEALQDALQVWETCET